jgi:hypothetical protein
MMAYLDDEGAPHPDDPPPVALTVRTREVFESGLGALSTRGAPPSTFSVERYAQLFDEVDGESCSTVRDELFLPGIQAADTNDVWLNWIARRFISSAGIDDGGVATMYQEAAERGAIDRSSSARRWTIANYFNTLPAFRGRAIPAGGVYEQHAVYRDGEVRHLARVGSNPTYAGDIDDVRALGVWATQVDTARFLAMEPALPAPGTASREHADVLARVFDNRRATYAGAQWNAFMHETLRETLRRFHCGKRVFAHSGGGAVLGYVLRLMDAVASTTGKASIVRSWVADTPESQSRSVEGLPRSFAVVGLEGVLSRELDSFFARLPIFSRGEGEPTLLRVYNFASSTRGRAGSDTWRDLIDVEIRAAGQRSLLRPVQPVDMSTFFNRALAGTLGHMWVGMNVLKQGRFTDYVGLPSLRD